MLANTTSKVPVTDSIGVVDASIDVPNAVSPGVVDGRLPCRFGDVDRHDAGGAPQRGDDGEHPRAAADVEHPGTGRDQLVRNCGRQPGRRVITETEGTARLDRDVEDARCARTAPARPA